MFDSSLNKRIKKHMEEETKDLKDGADETDSTGQEENSQEDETSSEEDVQERIKKLEEERDNYKKMALKYKDGLKKKPKTLSSKPSEKKGEENETVKIAREESRKFFEESNEKAAISKFLEEYPEYSTDKEWAELISNYHAKNGKTTPDGILRDLRRARVNLLYEKGDLEKLTKEAEERGQLKGRAEGFHASVFTSSRSTAKSSRSKDGEEVSEGAKRLAKKFNVDPKKLNQSQRAHLI